MRYKISWDKLLKENIYVNRYNPIISISKIINGIDIKGYSLYASISTKNYKIEVQPNGMYGHLYPKVLLVIGEVSNLSSAKKKVRSIFKELCDVYK